MKKGKFYKSSYPGDTAIILCTDSSSDDHDFSGVCVVEGNNAKVGDYSYRWTASFFYNEIKLSIN